MERVLGRYSSYIYAIVRIVAGSFLILHGTQKLFGFPRPNQLAPLNGLMTVAGVIEIVCGLMVFLGFFASIGAFILSGFLAVAYFMVHQPMGGLPIQNQGELAAIYAFLFLYIASVGSGVWSIDSVFRSGGIPRSSSL
jgi:putative oxidoreductase